MKKSLKNAIMALLAVFLIIASAGAASAASTGTLDITLSTGEMTAEQGAYTATVTYTPGEDQTLAAFAFGLESNNTAVTVTPKTFGGADFKGTDWNLQTMNGYFSGFKSDGKELTAGTEYVLGTFTIDTSAASAVTEDVAISFLENTSFVDKDLVDITITADSETLSANNPNSLILNTAFAVTDGEKYDNGKITGLKTEQKTELTATNATEALNQFIVINELGQKMTDASKFDLSYASNDAVRLAIVHDGDGTTQVPYYIGLVGNPGKAPAFLTATLKDAAKTNTLDSLDVEFGFAKAVIGNDNIKGGEIFKITQKTFEYTGESLYNSVYNSIEVLNHNNATKAGITRTETGFADGFGRLITPADYSLKIYDDNAAEINPNDLKDEGTYTFKVDLVENEHYADNGAIESGVDENEFTFEITTLFVSGKAVQDTSFNAANKATIFIDYTTHKDPTEVTMNSFDAIPVFTHYQQSLQLKSFNATRSVALPDSSLFSVTPTDNPTMITIVAGTNPTAKTTKFCIEGGVLGDVNQDGKINLTDVATISTKLGTTNFSDEEKFYGNIFGNAGNPGIVDAKLIMAQFLGGLDADYQAPVKA
ncbi:MAG TPA: hypothetical protein O0X39_07090 [Methanocorpusculum sp.]|nr:hypothetical protein [Methanocorpusculum sp.]